MIEQTIDRFSLDNCIDLKSADTKRDARTTDFDKIIEHVLLSGEEIQWTGQPDGEFLAQRSMFLLPFGFFWTAFSIGWTVFVVAGVLSGIKMPADLPLLLIALPGMLSIYLGVWMLKTPSAIAETSKNTFYLITNFRAIVLNAKPVDESKSLIGRAEGVGRGVISYFSDDLIQPELRSCNNRFDLLFARSVDCGGDTTISGFEGLAETDSPMRHLRALLLNRKSTVFETSTHRAERAAARVCEESGHQSQKICQLSTVSRFRTSPVNNRLVHSMFLLLFSAFFIFGGYCLALQEFWRQDIVASDRAVRAGEYEQSIRICQRTLSDIKEAPGIACPRTFRAHLMENFALGYLRTGKAAKAVPLLVEARGIRQAVILNPGENDSVTIQQRYLNSDDQLLKEALQASSQNHLAASTADGLESPVSATARMRK